MGSNPVLVDHSKKAFEDAVRVILTTFGVFTGFAIKTTLEAINFPHSASWLAFLGVLSDFRFFLCIAMVALLLRFIIGSAIHLNLCYVVEPRSKMPVMLFKDVSFLIVFGLIAVFVIKASDVLTFATRASFFIAIGLLWSVMDVLVRGRQTDPGEQTLFSWDWVIIDLIQLFGTAIVMGLSMIISADSLGWYQAFLFAIGYSFALYFDFRVVLAAEKPRA